MNGRRIFFESHQLPAILGGSSVPRHQSPVTNSFICRTSAKAPTNSFICHTSKIALPQVQSLPHLQTPSPRSVLPGNAGILSGSWPCRSPYRRRLVGFFSANSVSSALRKTRSPNSGCARATLACCKNCKFAPLFSTTYKMLLPQPLSLQSFALLPGGGMAPIGSTPARKFRRGSSF